MKVKKYSKKLHLWLAVPFGLVIVLVCFSGAMMMFEDEIVRLTHREFFYVKEAGQPAVTLDEAARRVEATLPEGVKATGVTVFADTTRTWQVSISSSRRAWVAFDPCSGEVIGRYERPAFFMTMFRLHRWLLTTPSGGTSWGKTLVGVSVLVFVVVILTGVVVWWPRTLRALKRGLSLSVVKGWRRFWYDLHAAGGMYALLFLLLMALTGLTWSFPWYRNAFYAVFGVEATQGGGHGGERAAREGDNARGDRSARRAHGDASAPDAYTEATATQGWGQWHAVATPWQAAYDTLVSRCPDAARISVSEGSATVAYDRLGNRRASDRYDLDPATGQVTGVTLYADTPASGKMRGWIYSLHVGSWGGLLTRVLAFLAALVGAALPLTGYYFWIRRLLVKRRGKS